MYISIEKSTRASGNIKLIINKNSRPKKSTKEILKEDAEKILEQIDNLKKEVEELEDHILSGKPISELSNNETLSKHVDWLTDVLHKYSPQILSDREALHKALQTEIGYVFTKVLECAGVFKRTPEGMDSFKKFIEILR